MCVFSAPSPPPPPPTPTEALEKREAEAKVEQQKQRQVDAKRRGVRSTLNPENLFAGVTDSLLGPKVDNL